MTHLTEKLSWHWHFFIFKIRRKAPLIESQIAANSSWYQLMMGNRWQLTCSPSWWDIVKQNWKIWHLSCCLEPGGNLQNMTSNWLMDCLTYSQRSKGKDQQNACLGWAGMGWVGKCQNSSGPGSKFNIKASLPVHISSLPEVIYLSVFLHLKILSPLYHGTETGQQYNIEKCEQ